MTEIQTSPEPTVDNKLELVKHLGEVQNPIKETITSDFIYAKLDEKDKEGITEMTANAQLAKNYYKYIINNTIIWNWNKKEEQWEQQRINKEQKEIVEKNGNILADNYMVRPYMIANLNRNTKENFLVKASVGIPELEEENNEETEKNMKETIKEALKAKN